MDTKEARAYAHSASAYPAPQGPRRTPLLLFALGAFIFFTVFFSTSSVQEVAEVAHEAAQKVEGHIPHPKLPNLLHNPFVGHSAAHKPPAQQKNSTSGGASWYNDWKWMNPFSSSTTYDDRAVLPPLKARTPIYTYYDAEAEKDLKLKEEETRLLKIWRRAWWAQGFRPVILGPADALKNPQYELLRTKKLTSSLEQEVKKWLAWGYMGKGILSNWLVLPMSSREDPDLTFLRRGEFVKLVRYEDFGNALYAGPQPAIEDAIKYTLNSERLSEEKSMVDVISGDQFELVPRHQGIAFYSPEFMSKNHEAIASELVNEKVKGFSSLADLITAHLHNNFLSVYTSGLAILNLFPHDMAVLTTPATILANALNTCPTTSYAKSCPPNRPKCSPCEPLKIQYPQTLSNTSILFTIGVIPHPYTLATLLTKRSELAVPEIRRYTERDPWLQKATEEVLTKGISGYNRITHFKEDVAGHFGQSHRLWHTSESDWTWKDLEWHFGFSFSPFNTSSPLLTIPTITSADYPEELTDLLASMDRRPTRLAIAQQAELVTEAKAVIVKETFKGDFDMRDVIEAWHLADTEAWRFVRAFEARQALERKTWEEEESSIVGTVVKKE